ncbi:MAG: response regulator [Methylococcales bacterium]
MINLQIIGHLEQLKHLFDKEGIQVCFFEDEVQALNTVEQKKPVVIILDYKLRQIETASYITLLLKANSKSKIIVIADELSDGDILACLIAGARGYQNLKQLNNYAVKMIKVINAGEAWVTRRMVAKLLDVLVQK